MNIVIGLIVIILLAHGFGSYSATVEQRHERASQSTPDNLTPYQREQCEAWRGWPKYYHPTYCEAG